MSEKLFRSMNDGDVSTKMDEKGNIIDPEMIELCRKFTEELIPLLEATREDIVATCLAAMLGQNIAFVTKNSDIPLETLVDRVTLAVRSAAEMELANVRDGDSDSHREH